MGSGVGGRSKTALMLHLDITAAAVDTLIMRAVGTLITRVVDTLITKAVGTLITRAVLQTRLQLHL